MGDEETQGTGSEATGGAHRASGRSRSRAVLSVVAILVVAGGVFVAYRFLGIGGTTAGSVDFSFRLTKAVGVPTAPEVGARDVTDEATLVAGYVAPVLDGLYTAAFLDRDAWSSGTYDAAWSAFEPEALAQAQADVAVLTAGADAATAFASIEPVDGTLRVKVLFDTEGIPTLVVASVNFEALASGAEGGADTAIVSTGRYFLRSIDGEWRIVAYVVDRADGPPTAEASS